VALLLGLAACASTPGAKPEEMSEAEHERAAMQHEQQVAPQVGTQTPSATITSANCGGRAGTPYGGCWTWVTNPTAEQQADAARHFKMAADHRAAAQSLRDAEASSCTGISEADRDIRPFDHREDITSVVPYVVPTSAGGKQQIPTTRASVASTGNGFAVTVESDDPASAKEILRRAQGLLGATGG
jgi:hypothetical protein